MTGESSYLGLYHTVVGRSGDIQQVETGQDILQGCRPLELVGGPDLGSLEVDIPDNVDIAESSAAAAGGPTWYDCCLAAWTASLGSVGTPESFCRKASLLFLQSSSGPA